MKTRRSLSGAQENTDINISPLIDMVFILLIFFIVTTVFVEEKGLGVDKPDPAAAQQTDENESVVFTLTRNGQVMFEGRALGAGGVSATVRDKIRREMVPVIVKVEKGAIANLIVRVIDEARLAGADKISLTSQ
ncbi:biopolymer transporter ExbD [Opitutales bacterium ASA1]|jgi:biopolymer transport protein ExbD|uniref:ExbD/TolR family protein n=1 Tax=Congregicoccus parvus TaxID=3081749 RepID=UPI002B2C08A9|nr:biopolymer transporter ExbD [Opitutales bacterium ASA1]